MLSLKEILDVYQTTDFGVLTETRAFLNADDYSILVQSDFVEDDDDGEDEAEAERRLPEGGRGKDETERRQIRLEQAGGDDGNHLREEDASSQPGRKGKQADEEGLREQNPRDAGAPHPEEEIEPELLLAALHQKAVGVDDKKAEHNSHKHRDIAHDNNHLVDIKFLRLAQRNHRLLGVNRVEDVKEADAERERQEIDGEIAEAAGDVPERAGGVTETGTGARGAYGGAGGQPLEGAFRGGGDGAGHCFAV